MRRIPFVTGDEQDVLGRKNARKFYTVWGRPGKTAAVKRDYRRRERRIGKAEAAGYLSY